VQLLRPVRATTLIFNFRRFSVSKLRVSACSVIRLVQEYAYRHPPDVQIICPQREIAQGCASACASIHGNGCARALHQSSTSVKGNVNQRRAMPGCEVLHSQISEGGR